MIIDAHTHVWRTSERRAGVKELSEAMRRAGVAHAIVIEGEPTFPDVLPSLNDLLAEVDGRSEFSVVASARPEEITAERLTELEQQVQSGKIKGFKLYLGYEHFYPSDSRLVPLYELAVQYSAPVMFHTGFLWDPRNRGLLKYANPLGIDEVAVRFRDLKIVIAHMGNPWIRECGLVVQKNPNVYFDTSGYFAEFQAPFSGEERSMFRSDLVRLHGLAGSYEKMLFGTDWPLCDMREYVAVVNAFDLTAEERDLVFWKNAATLFGIPMQS